MAPLGLPARLKFLANSAHFLATTAPATSAYLMTRCNELVFENQLEQPDTGGKYVCSACGTIMIMGWTSTVEKPKFQKHEHKDQSTDERKIPTPRCMIYKCEACGRKARQEIPVAKARLARKRAERSSESKLEESSQPSTRMLPPAVQPRRSGTEPLRSTRKKRGNWKQNSLQALLEQSKKSEAQARTAGDFGLDLMDLMKRA